MRMPGFTAEESIYRTTRQYRTHVTFNQTDGAIRPALVEETDEPVGWEFCPTMQTQVHQSQRLQSEGTYGEIEVQASL